MSASSYAPPVSSPPFYYDNISGLYVEVERHRYSISSCDRLYNLLTYEDPGPAYTKAGKLRVHQPPKHKDETQYFYTAQLTHYGLDPLKSKAAAKKALLEAFKGTRSELRVPDSVRKIERDLAADYEVKNAAAKVEFREKLRLQEVEEQRKRKKRKQEETELLAELSEKPSKKAKTGAPLDVKALSGVYKIAAPSVSDGWDCCGPLTLKLAPSSTANHLWGSFDFGVFEGTLRSCSSVTAVDSTIRFQWRGRENGEGESTYESENVAEFTFLGRGKFKGSMYWNCLGDFELVGKQHENASRGRKLERQVLAWKEEFRNLNDQNYERERVGRWGGWSGGYGEEEEGEESNSDTDYEGRRREQYGVTEESDEESDLETDEEDDVDELHIGGKGPLHRAIM